MSAGESTIVVERDVPCAMRDGTVLRGDLYHRGGGEPRPVLLHRTPYNKAHPAYMSLLMFHAFDAVERGYAVFIQDVRGRFKSDGVWTPLHCERDDGYDAVEWAAAQPWSNGKVGVYGSSYMGVTALQAVAAHPPHLAAAVVYMAGANYFDGWVYSGGAFEQLFVLRWCAGQAIETLRRSKMNDQDRARALERLLWILDHPDEALRFRPLIDVFGVADVLVPYWRLWLEHPHYDEFWQAVDPLSKVADAGVPILSIATWYDGFLKGHIDLHETLSKARAAGAAGAHEDLIVGPWDHEAYTSSHPWKSGEMSFGVKNVGGQAGFGATTLDWFDRWLRPTAKSGVRAEPSVRYFVIGPNEWRTAKQWPPSGLAQRLYLSGAPANSSEGLGLLRGDACPTPAANTFRHDPADPVPTAGGRHLGYGSGGVRNQSAVERRRDVLVFTGEPLTRPLTVAGAIKAELYVRSQSRSADFALKLVDVRPDGYCVNVADGMQRVRWPSDQRSMDEVRKIVVDLWQTAYEFPVGHRVRLEICGSNFPRFDVNDGIGDGSNVRSKELSEPYDQQVFVGGPCPSCVVLELEG